MSPFRKSSVKVKCTDSLISGHVNEYPYGPRRREPMLRMGARLASGSGIMFLQKTPDLQSHEGDAGPEDDKLLRQAGEAFVRHTEDAEAVQMKLDRIAGIDQSAKTAEAERTIGVEAATSSAASSMWYSLRN